MKSRLLAANLLACSLTLLLMASEASAQIEIDLTIAPSPPSSLADTLLNISGNIGIAVGMTIEPDVVMDGSDIAVSLLFTPPTGEIIIPSAQMLDEPISLGRLAPGHYDLTTYFYSSSDPVSPTYVATTSFQVVPEPASVVVCGLFAAAGWGWLRTQRRHLSASTV